MKSVWLRSRVLPLTAARRCAQAPRDAAYTAGHAGMLCLSVGEAPWSYL